MTLTLDDKDYQILLSDPLDVSIPLRDGAQNPSAWYIEPPKFEVVRFDDWTGSVAEGGSVNFYDIHFNPHAHGTHTECVGHISQEHHAINQHFEGFFSLARVISVTPSESGEDQVIDRDQIENALGSFNGKAVLIRTLPNEMGKLQRQYSHTNWPYLTPQAAQFLKEQGIEHLLIDLPSVDKEKDEGVLAAHHAFWDYPQQPRLQATITEMIYIPDSIADGDYLLNLQVAPFENDAAPSRPVLYRIEPITAS